MPRPKHGTKEGDIATAKWRETMLTKYGGTEGMREWLRHIGSKGGSRSTRGGFASLKIGKDGLSGRERARIAGAKGGRISRRREAKTYKEDEGGRDTSTA